MQREIKFRGKRVDNGEWVGGCLLYGFKENQVLIDTCKKFNYNETSIEVYEVIPETVGQFTGLTDKNGKEIYEGDVFQVAGNREYVVKYSEIGMSDYEPRYAMFVLEMIGKAETFFPFDEYAMEHGKIIGNIHDNPELINQTIK